ncbi:AraC family transcriptional regulator [Acuticoccus mangrovi]|uniref:Helix-turn-helix domain-containing protein n=1 Tax=Acuticoccus mangrovi TaxID=2796142 RepID=A0A934MN79_9HYPH|nr:AraC family transcriptional regulator [Acuticoccus mangrovi]MBJ3777944.1 helix-turn-helix domain-containing protein [Acuticoccus mangrovi]
MTSTRGLGPLPAVIEARGGERAVRRVFDRAGMPHDVLSGSERMVPLKGFIALFEHAAVVTGDELIGLETGRLMTDEFGRWATYARAAPTLGTCLVRIARGLAFHQSGTEIVTTLHGDEGRFTYKVGGVGGRQCAQHLEHAFVPVIEAMRLYLGPDWSPDRIEVNYPASPRLAALETLLGTAVVPGAARPAICFAAPLVAAARRAPPPAPISFEDLREIVGGRPPATIAGAIWHVIDAKLADGGTELPVIAEAVGLSPRTLQRRLQEEGASFKAVVDDVRLHRAAHLLERPTLAVTEIAYRLGYSDSAHFSRAFRRLTRFTPRAYRKSAMAKRRRPQ